MPSPSKPGPQPSKPGPQSARAKAAVSQNAIAHGVLANVPVLPGVEDEDEWRAYRTGIFDSLAPDGHFECALAERAARLFWRLRRVERYETESAALSRPVDPLAPDRLLPMPEVLDRVMRYEAHLHRLLTAVLHELEAAQTRRRGGFAPLARLDVAALSPDFPSVSPSHSGFRSFPRQ